MAGKGAEEGAGEGTGEVAGEGEGEWEGAEVGTGELTMGPTAVRLQSLTLYLFPCSTIVFFSPAALARVIVSCPLSTLIRVGSLHHLQLPRMACFRNNLPMILLCFFMS